jgi:hypothetical protein
LELLTHVGLLNWWQLIDEWRRKKVEEEVWEHEFEKSKQFFCGAD